MRVLLILCLGLLGCPELTSDAPVARCAHSAERCALPEGLVGVCDSIACPAGQSGACYKCMPQH